MISKLKSSWRLWAKSLGEKSGSTDVEADKIALIRTLVVGVTVISALTGTAANVFIAINFYLTWIAR